MSLGYYEMECRNCKTAARTKIEMEVRRYKKGARAGQIQLVQFKVQCQQCGDSPWYLEYNEINIAVKRYLDMQEGVDKCRT